MPWFLSLGPLLIHQSLSKYVLSPCRVSGTGTKFQCFCLVMQYLRERVASTRHGGQGRKNSVPAVPGPSGHMGVSEQVSTGKAAGAGDRIPGK